MLEAQDKLICMLLSAKEITVLDISRRSNLVSNRFVKNWVCNIIQNQMRVESMSISKVVKSIWETSIHGKDTKATMDMVDNNSMAVSNKDMVVINNNTSLNISNRVTNSSSTIITTIITILFRRYSKLSPNASVVESKLSDSRHELSCIHQTSSGTNLGTFGPNFLIVCKPTAWLQLGLLPQLVPSRYVSRSYHLDF